MKHKCLVFLVVISTTTILIFYSKERYYLYENIKKNDALVLETIKTLKKLIIFAASSVKENAGNEEIQKSLSIHFGYNLILDNDSILNNLRLLTIRDGKLHNSLGLQPKVDNQLNFAESLSKKYRNRAILYSDPSSNGGSIYLLYTTQNSPNTFLLFFPLSMLSPIKIQHLEKTKLNAFDMPALLETNKFLSDEFISENAIFYNNLNIWKNIQKKYLEVFLIFVAQAFIFLVYVAMIRIINLRKNQLLSRLSKIIKASTEETIIERILENQNSILELKDSCSELEKISLKLKRIAELNKKSMAMERTINKEIAKNIDYDLRKITQLTGDSTKNFNNGIPMSNQMIENLLNTIKDSTAKLLFLRTGQPNINAGALINVKTCLEKTLTIFGPQLNDLECKIDLTHFNEELTYRCPEIALIQTFNGVFSRLLFSMERANGNYIAATAKNVHDYFKLIFENSSLGIHPTITDTTELISSCLSVPNWISTKAIAKTINVSIEESFILGKGDTITLIFSGSVLAKGENKSENVYSIS